MKKTKKRAKKAKRPNYKLRPRNAWLCKDNATGKLVIVTSDLTGAPSVNPKGAKLLWSDSPDGPFDKPEGQGRYATVRIDAGDGDVPFLAHEVVDFGLMRPQRRS